MSDVSVKNSNETFVSDRQTESGIKSCRLYLSSPTYQTVISTLRNQCKDFSLKITESIKETIETATVFTTFSEDESATSSFVSSDDMRRLPVNHSYRFPLGQGSNGFLSFDKNLPRLLTNICFGEPLSEQSLNSSEPGKLSKIDLFLLNKIMPPMIHCWQKRWSGYFSESFPEGLAENAQSKQFEWLGGGKNNLELMNITCVRARFDVEFSTPDESTLKLPVEFFMPLMPLANRLFSVNQSVNEIKRQNGSASMTSLLLLSVDVSAEIMGFSLPLSSVKALKEGDIVPVEKPGSAKLLVNNVPIGEGPIAQQSGYLALQVSGISSAGGVYERC